MTQLKGNLNLISVPIGNMGDITLRATRALESGVYFAAEDTRKLMDLFKHLGIDIHGKQIFSFHDHSDQKCLEKLLKLLEEGQTLNLVSDAGSPLISDPAYPFIKLVLERGLNLSSCPGVSSPLVALELSGMPAHPFTFHGFFPREKGKGRSALEEITAIKGTHIFFEAPTRIMDTLDLIRESLPSDTLVCVARELTKMYESIYRFPVSQIEEVKEKITLKGEFVLLLYSPQASSDKQGCAVSRELKELGLDICANGAKPKKLAKLLSLITGEDSSRVYEMLNKK